MFRSIGKRVARKQEEFQSQAALELRTTRIIQEVMSRYASHISIQFKNEILFISTQHKSVASDISLHAKTLYNALRERGITCRRIVIK